MPASTLDFKTLPVDARLLAELRSDHAGECGAVAIYRGILTISQSEVVRRFARSHLRAELRHRRFFDDFLPAEHRSRLLPLWISAGWLLGAIPAVFGVRAVFITIAAVERFVEQHYLAQIAAMEGIPALAGLSAKLGGFCADEVEHGNDACRRLERTGPVGQFWSKLVAGGSMLGVAVARRI